MDVARDDFLAGAALAVDQHRGLRGRDLLGALHAARHRRIAHHHDVGFARRRLQDGGDQLGVGRQRQIFAGTLANRAQHRLRIVAGAAGDHRHGDPLARQGADHGADIVRHVAQHEVEPGIAAQARQRRLGIVGMVQPGAASHRDPRRLAELAGQRSDDQHAHRGGPYTARSALMISVIVTPSRVSSTMTTSPRATSRLLT